MSKKAKTLLLISFAFLVVAILIYVTRQHTLAVLDPQGEIASKQRNLILLTAAMSLVIVIPVFAMTFYFAWQYRETNTKARYQPDWDHSRVAETIWWAVPTIMILILAGITWKSSHDLDPFRSISSNTRPITVQVVALDWKWLFIYPEQQIASVNYVQFPAKTPVRFVITSDAPMNSFWIPQLGGQIYAMSGMSTHLNLIASNTGIYRGSSANISGSGFASMNFIAHSSSDSGFQSWVDSARASDSKLTTASYDQLALPSKHNAPKLYSYVDQHLYDTIVSKYMSPNANLSATNIEAEQ